MADLAAVLEQLKSERAKLDKAIAAAQRARWAKFKAKKARSQR